MNHKFFFKKQRNPQIESSTCRRPSSPPQPDGRRRPHLAAAAPSPVDSAAEDMWMRNERVERQREKWQEKICG